MIVFIVPSLLLLFWIFLINVDVTFSVNFGKDASNFFGLFSESLEILTSGLEVLTSELSVEFLRLTTAPISLSDEVPRTLE